MLDFSFWTSFPEMLYSNLQPLCSQIHETFNTEKKKKQPQGKKNQTKEIIIKFLLENLLKHSAIFIIS